jgi:hypothetical protein
MAGEAWRQQWAIGVETAYGVAVPATRQLSAESAGHLERQAANHEIRVATGTRDNVRGNKPRAVTAGGMFSQAFDADEIIELFLGAVQGGVTPTTALGASTWVFKPAATLDSQTWEWYDGANGWQSPGTYIDTIKFTWSAAANGDTKVEATLFAKDRVIHTITAALATRNPIWMEGWETQVYLDALGGTPGTTLFGTAISGSLTLGNKLGRKYFANNTLVLSSVPFGQFSCSGDLIIEANAAGITEYTNWDTSVDRLLRLSHGNNGAVIGTSALKRSIVHDIPCTWTAMEISGMDAETRVLKASFNYKYDVVNSFSYRATVVNSRPTAYI